MNIWNLHGSFPADRHKSAGVTRYGNCGHRPKSGSSMISARHRLFVSSAFVAAVMLGLSPAPVSAQQVTFASKEAAFTQGYSAFRGSQFDIAVTALNFAAKRGVMRAKYYLARIYSDNSSEFTDHARAYGLLRDIISGYATVDPKDYRVAPYVSKALTSIARYERKGIPEMKLAPSTKRALVFFNHAASYFNEPDAQFELAKHYLEGAGVEARVPYALNWLARLSKRGHAGAQAYLANLYWAGRYTVRDPVRALALITVAVENANEEDRFWIEDVHQNIFCDANQKTRLRVHQVVGKWRRRYARTQSVSVRTGDDLFELSAETQRTCSNGRIVGDLIGQSEKRGDVVGAGVSISAHLGGERLPALSSKRAALKMTRIRPDRSDRRSLNGFVLRSSSAGSAGLVSSAPKTWRLRRSKPSLNGFVLQGRLDRGN